MVFLETDPKKGALKKDGRMWICQAQPQKEYFPSCPPTSNKPKAPLSRNHVVFQDLLSLSSPVVPCYPFLGEGSPTEMDYRKKLVPLFKLLPELEDLVSETSDPHGTEGTLVCPSDARAAMWPRGPWTTPPSSGTRERDRVASREMGGPWSSIARSPSSWTLVAFFWVRTM